MSATASSSRSASWTGPRRSASARGSTGWSGGSDPLPGSPAPADYARRLSALLDAVRIPRCHLLGQSAAAPIVVAFAAVAPEHVVSPVFARTRPFLEPGARRFAESRVPRLLAPGAPVHLGAELVDAMGTAPAAAYVQAVEMMTFADPFVAAPGIRMPALAVAGSDDPLAPRETAARRALRGHRATLGVQPGADALLRIGRDGERRACSGRWTTVRCKMRGCPADNRLGKTGASAHLARGRLSPAPRRGAEDRGYGVA